MEACYEFESHGHSPETSEVHYLLDLGIETRDVEKWEKVGEQNLWRHLILNESGVP